MVGLGSNRVSVPGWGGGQPLREELQGPEKPGLRAGSIELCPGDPRGMRASTGRWVWQRDASRGLEGAAGWLRAEHVEPGREERKVEARWGAFHLSLGQVAWLPFVGGTGLGVLAHPQGNLHTLTAEPSARRGLFLVWGRRGGRGGRVWAARSRQGPGGTGQPPLLH